MNLSKSDASIFVPDGTAIKDALSRTTHLVIAAHQDDVEIMAPHFIEQCYRNPDRWLTATVVTGNVGKSKGGIYSDFTDGQIIDLREKNSKLLH